MYPYYASFTPPCILMYTVCTAIITVLKRIYIKCHLSSFCVQSYGFHHSESRRTFSFCVSKLSL